MTLADLNIGQTATILSVGGQGSLRQHFLDMGVLPGIPVTLVKYAPMGDPMELRIHHYQLTLRKADARRITVVPVTEDAMRNEQLSIINHQFPTLPNPSIPAWAKADTTIVSK